MKNIKHVVFDFAGEETKVAKLSNFLLSIPAFIMHGVIAPYEVTNQILKDGNIGGGMSPGVEWNPFEINKNEYQEIINDLVKRSEHGSLPGPHDTIIEKVIVDKEFENYTEWSEWLVAVTKKYTGRVIEIPKD